MCTWDTSAEDGEGGCELSRVTYVDVGVKKDSRLYFLTIAKDFPTSLPAVWLLSDNMPPSYLTVSKYLTPMFRYRVDGSKVEKTSCFLCSAFA